MIVNIPQSRRFLGVFGSEGKNCAENVFEVAVWGFFQITGGVFLPVKAQRADRPGTPCFWVAVGA